MGVEIDSVAPGVIIRSRNAFGAMTREIVVDSTTNVYTANDQVGSLLNFADLIPEAGGAAYIETATLLDDQVATSLAAELWLFSRPVTDAGENAAHSLSDADARFCVGVIAFSTYYTSALNQNSQVQWGRLVQFDPTRRGLYGLLVTRGAPTYVANGVRLRLSVLPV